MPLPRPDVNAKRMFIVGLLGLPWLWTVNVLYHYKAVYGKGTTEDTTNEEDNDDDENEGILGGMMSSNDDENADEEVPKEIIQSELSKWVKISTMGSMISFVALISWIIAFQVNKENFGSNWFVMSPEEDILTGW